MLKPLKMSSNSLFLYIDPLKQGLKPYCDSTYGIIQSVFIHRSIKTRIETSEDKDSFDSIAVFIHRSIKTRIETENQSTTIHLYNGFYT